VYQTLNPKDVEIGLDGFQALYKEAWVMKLKGRDMCSLLGKPRFCDGTNLTWRMQAQREEYKQVTWSIQ